MPLYIAKVDIWTGLTDALRTDGLTLKDRATQLLTKYKSGALVTQKHNQESMIVRTSAQGTVVQAQAQWWGWSPPSRLARTSTLALPSRCQGRSRTSRTLARAKKVRILYHLQHFL